MFLGVIMVIIVVNTGLLQSYILLKLLTIIKNRVHSKSEVWLRPGVSMREAEDSSFSSNSCFWLDFSDFFRMKIIIKCLHLLSMNFDLYNHDNFWNVITGTAVTWGACYCVLQTQVQRYCSMESAKKAKKY
jgi:hypothetical protein